MDMVAIRISNVPKPANNVEPDPNCRRPWTGEATSVSSFFSVMLAATLSGSLLSVAVTGKLLRLNWANMNRERNLRGCTSVGFVWSLNAHEGASEDVRQSWLPSVASTRWAGPVDEKCANTHTLWTRPAFPHRSSSPFRSFHRCVRIEWKAWRETRQPQQRRRTPPLPGSHSQNETGGDLHASLIVDAVQVVGPAKPRPVNLRQARCKRSSSTSLRSRVMPYK
jgi:hypothetical protein